MPPPSGDGGKAGAGAAGGGDGCPFAGGAAAAAAGGGTTSAPTTCPVAAAAAAAAATATTATPGVCPFGFGAGGSGKGGAASTPLHCPLCRSLLFDCHAAKPCGHKACGECLSRFRDCPLCGADVDGTEPDAAAQGMVDAFLGAHGVYPDAVAAALDMGPLMQELLAMSGAGAAAAGQQGANGSSSDTNDNKSALTAALLQGVALRSYAGGNVSAALARFEAAREALLRVLEEEEEKEKKEASGCSSKAALALGVVLGGIGDCHRRRQGSEAAAEASYKASAERLAVVADVDLTEQQILVAADDAAASSSPVSPLILEARQALGVTLNKLGDLNYARGDIEAALNEYRRALGLRKARLGTLERSGAATPAAAAEDARLEVAAALIKAGDAATRLPAEQTHAGAYFAEARTLLRALGGGGGDGNAPPTLDRARAAKRDRLMDALEAVEKGS